MIYQNSIYLSICIPACGREEFVRNTLNSIYSPENLVNCSLLDFEVVLSDNSPNKSLEMLSKEFKFSNLNYCNSNCEGFMNSYFALAYGKGKFLKLHNSQEILNPGSLKILIDIAKSKEKNKPIIFFTSGLLLTGKNFGFNNFNNFMCKLSYWSSWSNGFSIWKDDFDKMKETLSLNPLFPHTSLLLTQNNKSEYIINDQNLFKTQFVRKRGGHNKFYAFSIEYPSLIDSCYKRGDITMRTRKYIIDKIRSAYLPLLFFNVKISKRETYNSEGFKDNLKEYFPRYSYHWIVILSFLMPIKILWRKAKIRYILKSKF